MSATTWTIVAMAAVTYAARWWGLAIPSTRLQGYPRRVLDLVPVAVFAALVATGLPGDGPVDGLWRVGASAATVAVGLRTRSLGLALFVGLSVYLGARVLGWA